MDGENDGIRNELIDFIENRKSFTMKDLEAKFGTDAQETITQVLNEFLKRRRINIFSNPTDESSTWFQVQSEDDAKKYNGLTQEHMLVLQEIKSVGVKGVYKKDLKRLTNLPTATISRVLKMLESRKLVKPFKTVSSKTMNLYILYELQPTKEHTGGPWYTDQEFDDEAVEMFSKTILYAVDTKGPMAVRSFIDWVTRAKLINAELTESDFHTLFAKLSYEGKLEKLPNQEHLEPVDQVWKRRILAETMNHMEEVPCGVCELQAGCRVGGAISPLHCEYMDSWLKNEGLDY